MKPPVRNHPSERKSFPWIAPTICFSVVVMYSGLLFAASPPAPYGPVPSPRQLASQDDETYAFAHFGVNTFTNLEWGNGDEKESLFNPTDFDAEQIVRAVREGGMKGLILTAKHHDGFCLWPSAYTAHSVRNSPWRNGAGDVVREVSDACRKQGVKFGIYLSPWDRNHAEYGRPAYPEYYKNQLRELMTNYGPVFEVWFDGANGGDGYYGGAREKRTVDTNSYYDLPGIDRIVRELQPGALIQRDLGPDGRWGGNESGTAGVPCWSTLRNEHLVFPTTNMNPRNLHGERSGDLWMPAEMDVSIRPGWFYHANEDARVRDAKNLLNLYYLSVGRGAKLLLNIPPDKRGRIAEPDIKALREFKSLKDRTFATDLARGARVSAGNVRGGDAAYDGAKATDADPETYWCSDDGVTAGDLTLEWSGPVRFNLINIQERIQLGQRVDGYEVEHWDGNAWVRDTAGQSIGHRVLAKLDKPVTTTRVRLKITSAAACPAISAFGLYLEPDR